MDELTRLALPARDGERVALRAFLESSPAEVRRFVAHQIGADEGDDATPDGYVRARGDLIDQPRDAAAS